MKYKKQFVFGSMILISFVFLFVLPLGHDLWYHMYRLGAMAVELENHPFTLPIRILSDTYNGYGYGAPLYYGDVFLYIPAFFVSLGFDIVLVYKLFIIAIFWGAFGVSYYSAKLISKDSNYNLLFAYGYTLSTGFAMNLCIRSAIGEVLAMVFMPLVFASFYGLLYKNDSKSKYIILLALSMCSVALSHMISLLLCGIVLIVWALMEWRIVFCKGKWVEILKAAVLMLASSASFLFPMFEQMLYQKVQTPGNNDYQKQAFLDYSIEWMDYFIPYDVKKAVNSLLNMGWDTEFWHPGAIGLFAIVIIVFSLMFKIKLSRKEKIVYFASLGFLLALGIAPVMNIAKEFLSFMQFPWRILPLITVGIVYSAYNMMNHSQNRKMELWLYLMILGIFGFAVGPRYAYQAYVQRNDFQYIREERADYLEKYLYCYNKNSADNLYLAKGVLRDYYLDRGDKIESNHEDVEYTWSRQKGEIVITLPDNSYDDLILEVPMYMYKGYSAELAEDGTKLETAKSENSLVNVHVGDLEGNIRVYYGGTVCQKLSDIISFITLVMLVLYNLKLQNRRKKEEEPHNNVG